MNPAQMLNDAATLQRASCFSLGQRRGTLSYKLVPTAIEGALSPEGAQRACERSTPRSGVDGERGRGSLTH